MTEEDEIETLLRQLNISDDGIHRIMELIETIKQIVSIEAESNGEESGYVSGYEHGYDKGLERGREKGYDEGRYSIRRDIDESLILSGDERYRFKSAIFDR